MKLYILKHVLMTQLLASSFYLIYGQVTEPWSINAVLVTRGSKLS